MKKNLVLKLYRFGFKGQALGGKALVLAFNKRQALKLLNARGENENWPIQDLAADTKGEAFVKEPQVLEFDNGDY